MDNQFYFESIRESRGSYYVEYQPPIADQHFATLSLVFPDSVGWNEVNAALKAEVRHWIERYPVPLMIWAFDSKEDTIRPPDRDADCLVAWKDSKSGKIVESWNYRELSAHLEYPELTCDWREIYRDVPVRTDAEVKFVAEAKFSQRRREIRRLKIALVLWFAVIPAGYAIFEFFGPAWWGAIGLAIVLWQALKTALQIWGHAKPSAKEKEKAERQRKMEHYFYHCEHNPLGFERLKVKNLENGLREQVRREAEQLARENDH